MKIGLCTKFQKSKIFHRVCHLNWIWYIQTWQHIIHKASYFAMLGYFKCDGISYDWRCSSLRIRKMTSLLQSAETVQLFSVRQGGMGYAVITKQLQAHQLLKICYFILYTSHIDWWGRERSLPQLHSYSKTGEDTGSIFKYAFLTS